MFNFSFGDTHCSLFCHWPSHWTHQYLQQSFIQWRPHFQILSTAGLWHPSYVHVQLLRQFIFFLWIFAQCQALVTQNEVKTRPLEFRVHNLSEMSLDSSQIQSFSKPIQFVTSMIWNKRNRRKLDMKFIHDTWTAFLNCDV